FAEPGGIRPSKLRPPQLAAVLRRAREARQNEGCQKSDPRSSFHDGLLFWVSLGNPQSPPFCYSFGFSLAPLNSAFQLHCRARSSFGLQRSSNSYATGVSNSVSSRQNNCPPMIVTAMAERCALPAPCPNAVGIKPAMIANVVIRIGRKRARSACRIASRKGAPSARRWLV